MTKPIGIGIIGGSPERGWALDAHMPAIDASPDLELRAVSTSRRETADKAAVVFGVPAYDNAAEMVARDDVDLVVVNVKVPLHFDLVAMAFNDLLGENLFKPMVDGYGEGEDARDVYHEAIAWWERELDAVDAAVRTS